MSTDNWLGGNGSFQNASDWSTGAVPGASDDAVITASGSYTVTSSSNATVNTITTGTGITLAITGGTFATASVSGTSTNQGTISLGDNTNFDVTGVIDNLGTISINSAGNTTSIFINAAKVTLEGAGSIVLGNSTNNRILGSSGSDVLDNAGSTISGAGQLGAGQLTLDNGGTITANQTTALVLDTGNTITNTGLLYDTGTGGLVIQNSTVKGGRLKASGEGSHIDLNGGTIAGATLQTTSGGVIQDVGTGTLDGSSGAVDNTGTIRLNDNTTLGLLGTIENTGTIILNSAGNSTNLIVQSATVTLKGGGTVVLANNPNDRIYGSSGADTLDNVDNTISGEGQIGIGQMGLINGGTIDATLGAAIILNTNPVTNTGVMEDTGSGGLVLQNTVVNGGTFEALVAGSHIDLSNGTIGGGATLKTAMGGIIQVDNSGTLDGTSGALNNTGTVLLNDNTSLTLLGTINNTGNIAIDSGGNNTNLIIGAGTTTLTGSGTITLDDAPNNRIYGSGTGGTLDNVDNTISGAGQIGVGDGSFTLVNASLIDADESGNSTNYALVVNTSGNTVTNTGILEDTGTGGLVIANTTVSGGTIEALGAGSHVDLNNATITGGAILATTSTAVIQVDNNATLDGTSTAVNNTGTLLLNDNTSLTVLGTLDNTGTVEIDSAGNDTNLVIGSPTVTLKGGGTIVMGDAPNNRIYSASGSAILINVDNTISGAGQLGVGDLGITNESIIDANGANALTIQTNGPAVVNTGTIENTGTGGLVIYSTTISGGLIEATGAGTHVDLNNGTIAGATMSDSGGGLFQVDNTGTLDGSATAVTDEAMVRLNDNTNLYLLGTIDNTGAIDIDSAGNYTNLIVNSAKVVLQGGGTIVMSDTGNNRIYGSSGADILDNVDQTISGAGQIGAGQMTLINAGTIDANLDQAITIYTGGNIVTNTGMLEATGTGGLVIYATTIKGGTIEALGGGAHVDLAAGATITSGTTLVTSGGGFFQDVNSATLGSGTGTITSKATLQLDDNVTLNLVGTLYNEVTLNIESTGNTTNLIIDSAKVVLRGGGTVVMSDTVNNRIFGASGTDILDNIDNTISGAGQIGAGQLRLINAGIIDGNEDQSLTISTGGNIVTNSGTIESTGTGGVIIYATTMQGGKIEALGAGTHVDLTAGSTIEGGTTLATSGGGVFQDDNSATLDGSSSAVNTGAFFRVNDNTTLYLLGTINNSGTIDIASAGNTTNVILNAATVTLEGRGTVTLSDTLNNRIYGASGSDVLDNVNDTLSGSGQIGAGQMELTNGGTIDSTGNSGILINTGGTGTNTASGVIEATGSGGLVFQNGTYTNSGVIAAFDGSFVTFQSSATNTNNSGGTLTGGTWAASASGHGAMLSITGGAVVTDAATIILSGTGSVFQAGDGNNFTALETSLTTIAAGGALEVLGGRGYATSNVLTVNGTVELGGGSFTDGGLTNFTGSTLTGGTFIVSGGGSFQLPNNVSVTTLAATVELIGSGSNLQSLNTSGSKEVTIDSTLTSITAAGALEILGGRNYTTTHTLKNSGTLALGGGTLTSASLTDLAGSTLSGFGTVTPVFTEAGTVTASGGTLGFTAKGDSFSGTFNGSGTIGFAGGTDAIASGTTISVAGLSLSGGAAVTIAEALSYGGTFTQAKGTSFALGANALTLRGTSSIAGTISSTAVLTFSGGSATIASGASLQVSSIALTGASTTVTLAETLTFTNKWTQSAATLDLSAVTLTLHTASFTGATVDGSGELALHGSTSVNGLTIGGTAELENTSTLKDTGTITVGDTTKSVAKLVNATGATLDLDGNVTIGHGTAASSSFTNDGKVVRNAGTGLSQLALTVTNSGTFEVATGTLELTGKVSGTGSFKIDAGTSLEFGNNTVASTQTVNFAGSGGDLIIQDAPGFAGSLSGFGQGQTIDLAAFKYGSTEKVGFVENGAGTEGVLTVKDGSKSLNVTLFGQYVASGFGLMTDGGVGSDVTYTPPAHKTALLGVGHH